MWDYTEEVLDHYRNPRNVGKIDDADAIGEAGSLACGGCGSAVASSSMMTEMIIGKPIEEVRKLTNKDIADALGGLPPEKMHCSVMGHEALEDALKNYFDEELTIEDVNSYSENKIVCTCFNVTEQQIIEAIKVNNLKTVEDVTNYTKAGGACGRCKGTIQEIINKCLKETLKEKTEKPKLSSAQKILKINKVIENQIAPELQKDGGDIELIDIDENKVYVKLHGRCSQCRNSVLTLKSFVEQTLKDAVDNEIEVINIEQ